MFPKLCAKTTVTASESFETNRMWLNGEEVPFEGSPRLQRCLKEGELLSLYTKDPSIMFTIYM